MSPFSATLATGTVLLVLASLLLWNGSPIGALARTFPRSRRAAWLTVGISATWTLYLVTQLGEADFGNYRVLIFVVLAALAVLSVRYVPDFLSVRGTCALTLLLAGVVLSATFMNYEAPALLTNAFAYVAIVLALYLAVSPFRVRDFVQWLFARAHRARIFGACVGAYGLLLFGMAFNYS